MSRFRLVGHDAWERARCRACGAPYPADCDTPLCDDCYVRATCDDDDPRSQLEALLGSLVDAPEEP